MQSTIGQLHVRYRGIGSLGTADIPRVRSIIEDEMLAELDGCLQQALDGDRAVYVIRRARCDLTLGRMTRQETARRAAARLAQGIVKTMAEGQGDDLVRFESEGVYLARFVADLLRGAAWGQWYYRPLRRFERLSVPEAIAEIVREHADAVPELLAYLHAAGAVEDFLTHVGGRGLRSLVGPPSAIPPTPGSARPIFAAVIHVFEAVAPPLSAAEYEVVFDNWILVHDSRIDWRDRASLTAAAASMLAALLSETDAVPQIAGGALERALSTADWLDAGVLRELVTRLGGPARSAVAEVVRVLDQLGALDRASTRRRLIVLVAAEGCVSTGDIIRALRRHRAMDVLAAGFVSAERLEDAGVNGDEVGAWLEALCVGDRQAVTPDVPRHTPQAIELLGDLRQVIRDERLTFRGGPEDHVRLYAALVHRYPRWLEHGPLVATTIEHVRSSPAGALTQIEREIAQSIDGGDVQPADIAGGIATECAGIFLLLRAVADARLAHLANASEYPASDRPLPHLLSSLALHWCGSSDSAVSRLVDDAPSLEELRAAWRATPGDRHLSFQAALLRLLAAQRMTDATELRLQTVNAGDDTVLLGGCEIPGLWPFASLLHGRALDVVTSEWVDRWEAATGVRPSVLHEPVVTDGARAPWDALSGGQIGISEADVSLTTIANSIIKLWARWLRQFSGSGVPYLLQHFIRRRGLIVDERNQFTVYMERKPLDLVLEMAGYDRDLEPTPGVLDRRVRFRWRS